MGQSLLVAKSAPGLVIPSQTFTYTITGTNYTAADVNNVLISDTVPANATFVSASDGGSLVGGTVVSWTIPGPVASGGTVVRTFQVTASASNGVTVVNDDYGIVAGNWTTPTMGSAVTTSVFEDIPTDIQLVKTGPTTVITGEDMVYTLVVSNTSVTDAENVVLTDTLPLSTTYAADSIGASTNPTTGVYVWALGTVAAGTGQTYYLTATVDAGTPSGTLLTNEAEVSTTTDEIDVADNQDEWASTAYAVVTIAEARARQGETLMVEGTVTAEPGVFTYQGTNRYLYMEDGTGGILVYRGGGLNPVARGNKVRVLGSITEYRAETEIVPVLAGDVVDLGAVTPVTPAEVDTGAVDESVEGELVQVLGWIVSKPTDYQLLVDDGTGAVEVYRFYNLGLEADPNYIDTAGYQVGDYIEATGVSRGYDNSGLVSRQILPRGPTDLQEFYQVTFVYHDVEDVVLPGEDVYVSGSFNGDDLTANPLAADAAHDVFSTTVTLDAPGVITYTYVVKSGGDQPGWLNTEDRTADVQASTTLDDYRDVVVGYAQLMGPPAIALNLGETTEPISGQVGISGVTAAVGEGRGVWAELGYGTGTNLATWTWQAMTYPVQRNGVDVYLANLTPAASGVYSYAVRFDGNRGTGNPNAGWTYGDLDGATPGDPYELSQTGVLTVTGPSLSLTKGVQPAADVRPGSIVTYTLTLTNDGDGLATGVALTDVLPAELTFAGWVEQNGAVESDGTITWSGDLAAGGSVAVVFTAQLSSDPTLYGQIITNQAVFSSENGGGGTSSAPLAVQLKFKLFLPMAAAMAAD